MIFIYVALCALICIVGVPYTIGFFEVKKLKKNLAELQTAPFQMKVDDRQIYFDLGGFKLYCDYQFDIRKDGTYGLCELTLKGINTCNGRVELEVGESIIPLIGYMSEFNAWAATTKFKVSWEQLFKMSWDKTLSKIDNLDVIESAYEQRKGKKK